MVPQEVVIVAIPESLRSRLFSADILDKLTIVAKVIVVEDLQSFDLVDTSSLRSCRVLVTGWGSGKFANQLADQMPSLEIVLHSAGSVKTTIPKSVFDSGVVVASAREVIAESAARYVVGLVLLAQKRAFEWSAQYVRTKSRRSPLSNSVENVKACTIGVVGASAVGSRVVRHLAALGFGDILLYDPHVNARDLDELGVTRVDSLRELCSKSSIVTLHAPENPETNGMIGNNELAALRDGSTIINAARGSLVDQDALVTTLIKRRIFAILDVSRTMPIDPNSMLWTLPNVFLTPHIAGPLDEERWSQGEWVVEQALSWFEHGSVARVNGVLDGSRYNIYG